MTIWPLFDLRIRLGDLLLRPLTESQAMLLAQSLPPDLEQNPAAYRFGYMNDPQSRALLALQEYWSAYGSWTIESWRLPFGVWRTDRLLGVQTLEGDAFLQRRVVDSASWLMPEARGSGTGQAMRRAMLAFAFGALGAEEAISSAWEDNHASLGVSRALGYRANGQTRHAHLERVGYLANVRLTREAWEVSGFGAEVEVSGFGPCAPLFGL